MSRGIKSDSTTPSLRQALLWISLKALSPDGGMTATEISSPVPSGGENTAQPGSSGYGGNAVQVVFKPEDELILGTGVTGPVFGGTLGDTQVAIKWSWSNNVSLRESLEHEGNILNTIQGSPFTANLQFCGTSYDRRYFLLVTSLIKGRTLDETDSHLLPQAKTALQYVHSKGLCHGDVRLPNFMVTKDKDGREIVVVLDFGRSFYCSQGPDGRSLQLQEIEELSQLFQEGRQSAPSQLLYQRSPHHRNCLVNAGRIIPIRQGDALSSLVKSSCDNTGQITWRPPLLPKMRLQTLPQVSKTKGYSFAMKWGIRP